MKWLIDLSTRSKLFYGFGLMMIFLAGVIATAYTSIVTIQRSQEALFREDFFPALDSIRLRSNLNRQEAILLRMMLATRLSDREQWHQEIRHWEKKGEEILQGLFERDRDNPRLRQRLEEFKGIAQAFQQARDAEIIPRIASGRIEEAKQLLLSIQAERYQRMWSIAREIEETEVRHAQDLIAQSTHHAGRSVRILAVIGGLALLMSALIVIFLDRVIAGPLQGISRVIGRIASGDLSVDLPVSPRADEVGTLMQTCHTMVENLREMIQAIGERTISLTAEIGERRRAEDALRQQLMRILLLNQITRAIAERQDLDSIFHVVLERLEEKLSVDIGSIFLFEPQTDTMRVAARGPKSQQLALGLDLLEGARIPVAQTVFGPCMGGEMVYLPDLAQIDRPIPQRLTELGIHASLTAPLAVEGQTIGVLAVGRCAVDGFDSAEGEFLRMLGEHVALAVHQARLHQDLQEAYDELRQTQRAMMQQERFRALGQMASGIAHDINNALSPIVGFTDLLLMRDPNLSERAKQYLKNIQTAATDIAQIVARMREFYRKRAEREPLLSIDLNSLVGQVVELTRPRWKDIPQKSGIVIEMCTELEPTLPCVPGIESEIREALTNLIFNAVDAMPRGGTLTIRTRLDGWAQEGNREKAPHHLLLEVADTGVGMDEKARQHCLEPFFSTKGERGTGLGLAMVYGVMQRHEGQIEIESALGQGTTMRLLFPVYELSERTAPAVRRAMKPLPPLRVLYIDDEPMLRELVQEILKQDGHQVEMAEGGREGLEQFRAARERGEPFEVVITDLGMPYVSGREVAQRVKRESPTTPVILLTGWGGRLKAEGDLPAQVDYVLSKPPRAHSLREALLAIAPILQGAR